MKNQIKFITVKSARSHGRCEACIKRKKSCDRGHPTCSWCLKHNIPCIYKAFVSKRKRKKKKPIVLPIKPSSDSMKEHVLGVKFPENNYIDLKEITDWLVSWTSPEIGIDNLLLDNSTYSLKRISNDDIPNFDLNFRKDRLEVIGCEFLSKFKDSEEKYYHTMKLFLPLAQDSRPLFYSIVGWCMLLKPQADNIYDATLYLKKAEDICEQMKDELKKNSKSLTKKYILSLVATLSCLLFASSSNGDSKSWRKYFESIYSTLNCIGLEEFFNKVRESSLGLCILYSFFLNDMKKVIKVTDDNKVGTLFPLKEYKRLISFNFDGAGQFLKVDDSSISSSCDLAPLHTALDLLDPPTGCCIGLFFRLGELNTLSDQFLTMIHTLDDVWGKLNKKLATISKSQMLDFITSVEYRKYEDIRLHMHDWVQTHTEKLIQRINHTLPRIAALKMVKDPIEREHDLTYFRVLQYAILLFVQIKLQEAPLKTFCVKRLMLHCYRNMRQLIVPEFISKLIFPLLVTGAAACEERDRIIIREMYLEMNKTSNSPNLSKAWEVIQESWKLNPDGDTFDRSQNIINQLDWNICLT